MPARPLAPGDASIGAAVGVALPTGALERARHTQAAAASLTDAGFAATLSGRLGIARRVETTVAAGPTHLALGARWAAVGPDPESPDAWDLAFGLQGMAIFGGQDDPDDDFELHAVAGGGGIAEVRGGRTWSDFVSVWVAVRAGVVAAELDLADRETTDSARLAWTGGAVGLRVGLRHVFTAFEIGAHWTDVSSGRRGASGFVVTPAIGLAIETR